MKSIKNLVFVIAVIVFAGCGTATDHTSPSVDRPSTGPNTSFVISTEGRNTDGHLSDFIGDIYVAGKDMKGAVKRYEEGGITAKELSDFADELVASNSGHSILRQVVPQIVSHVALNALLENEEIEGIEFYVAHHTKVLVDNKSPHAEDVARALDVLEGYWSDDDIQDIAEKAIVNAENYIKMSSIHSANSFYEDDHEEAIPMKNLKQSRSDDNSNIGFGIQSLERLLEE